MRIDRRITISHSAFVMLFLAAVSVFILDHGWLLFIGSGITFLLFYRLNQPFKPTPFSWMLLYHFLQISTYIFLVNYKGVSIDFQSSNAVKAIIFSYAGLVFLFMPLIYYQSKLPAPDKTGILRLLQEFSAKRVFNLYVCLALISAVLGVIAFRVPALTQIILSVGLLKWIAFILLALNAILRKQYLRAFIAVCFIEFAMGLASYFSDFKTVLIFLFCVWAITVRHISFRNIFLGIMLVVAGGFIALKWTTIKGEYRTFLNAGSNKQNVNVSGKEALSKLIVLSTQERRKKEDPVEALLNRLQYTYHLSLAMDRVPTLIPYSQGSNIAETFNYVFIPRVLNPQKPVFQATVKTHYYTGLAYAGFEQGTSFSLGYFADLYVDFGEYGMLLCLALFGLLYGSLYFLMMRNISPNYLFNLAVCTVFFIEFYAYENDITLLLGRLYTKGITFLILSYFVFPYMLRYLKTVPQSRLSPAI